MASGITVTKVKHIILTADFISLLGETLIEIQKVALSIFQQPACDRIFAAFKCFPKIS